MQATTRPSAAMTCAVAICALAASTALAEAPRAPFDAPSTDVGTAWNVLSIPIAGFVIGQNVSSLEYQILPDGYAYVRDPSDLGRTITFWAPVNLPAGAQVGHLYLYAYDSLGNATSRVVADLRRFTGYGSICTDSFCTHPPVPPASESLASTGSNGDNGYTLEGAVLDPPHPIANYRAHYAVVTSFENPSQHGGLAFKGVEICGSARSHPALDGELHRRAPDRAILCGNRSNEGRRHNRWVYADGVLPGQHRHATANGRVLRSRAWLVLAFLIDGRNVACIKDPLTTRPCRTGHHRVIQERIGSRRRSRSPDVSVAPGRPRASVEDAPCRRAGSGSGPHRKGPTLRAATGDA